MQHTVRENRHTRGAGEHPGAAPRFLPLCLQNAYRILCQRQGTVGVFRFQRCLHHLTVDPGDLPPYPEVTPLQIDVLPLRAEKFSPAEPSGQLQVVELKHAAVPCLPEEGLELLHQQCLHLSVLQPGQGTALCRIAGYQFLLLSQFHGRGNDLMDVPHRLGAKPFGLFPALNPIYPSLLQQPGGPCQCWA